MPNFYNKYPYTDFHELNLDWILETIKSMQSEITNFIGTNQIKYANPLFWNIASQYEANTIVVDDTTKMAYISAQPVPSGIAISNTSYWIRVLDLSELFDIYVTPEMYGAKGDGVTDDTAALQAALNSSYVTIILRGDYNINSASVPNNKHLIGMNGKIRSASAIDLDEVTDVTIEGLYFTTTTTGQETVLNIDGCTNINIKDCEFEGVYGGTIVGKGLINVNLCSNCTFKNIILHDSNAEGLLINNSKHCNILGGKYYDCLRGSGIHVGNNDALDTYGWHLIDGVETYNCAGSNIGMSGYRIVCTNCFIHDNTNTTYAIVLGHPNAGGSECIVSNCLIKNNNNGIYIYEANDTIITDNFIDGNNIPYPGHYNEGITASANSYNISAIGNTIMKCERGISGVTIANDNNIHDCTIGIRKNINPDIDTIAHNNIIKDCTTGISNAIDVIGNTIVTTGSCIDGYSKHVADNTIKSDGIPIYCGTNNGISFIHGNYIETAATSSRAAYLAQTGVFEYNMLAGHTASISAGGMTTTNNYDFHS